jgi:hypothetical protein
MAEFRQRKTKDLLAPLLSLGTEGHGKQHTLVGAGVVHVGGAWMHDVLAVQLSTATEEWAHPSRNVMASYSMGKSALITCKSQL